MANLRMLYDNAADRATITASSEAGSLVATNLQNDIKSQVWRSTTTTATLTLEWPEAEMVGVAVLPFTNLTSTSTVQVQGYTNITDTTPVFDTGAQMAVASALGEVEWGTLPLGVNAYTYGGGAYATVWFPIVTVTKLVITLTDVGNTSGYIESARVVTGAYWSPQNNCEYGAQITANDLSKHERSDAGDLHTDIGPRYRSMSMNLTYMPTADRNQMWRIIFGSGMGSPIFFSLSPEETDDVFGEQIFQMYGKLSKSSALTYQFYNQFNSAIEIEEI